MSDPIAEQYRRQAANAEKWAEQSTIAEHKKSWSEIAERWLSLARQRDNQAQLQAE